MAYFKLVLVVGALALFYYLKRHGFRRAWYVLRTGNEHPDWNSLGPEYFLGKKAEKKAPHWPPENGETAN